MRNTLMITVDGRSHRVEEGTSVAAALMMVNHLTRTSVSGEQRTPLCGMGICMECRVTIDGVPYRRGCQVLCASGMEIDTK